jgi:hypothetical protein
MKKIILAVFILAICVGCSTKIINIDGKDNKWMISEGRDYSLYRTSEDNRTEQVAETILEDYDVLIIEINGVRCTLIAEKINDEKFIMVWTIRPDGFYWMDSWGFGAEDYESVSLYSYIDAKGNFMAPFRLYEIGTAFYGDYKLKRNTI